MKKTVFLVILMILSATVLLAEEKIDVFPARPYDGFIIYQTLAFFWIGIIGLVIIIRMKLREIERTQRMNLDKEEKEIPLLD
jgi:hypothetical protein